MLSGAGGLSVFLGAVFFPDMVVADWSKAN